MLLLHFPLQCSPPFLQTGFIGMHITPYHPSSKNTFCTTCSTNLSSRYISWLKPNAHGHRLSAYSCTTTQRPPPLNQLILYVDEHILHKPLHCLFPKKPGDVSPDDFIYYADHAPSISNIFSQPTCHNETYSQIAAGIPASREPASDNTQLPTMHCYMKLQTFPAKKLPTPFAVNNFSWPKSASFFKVRVPVMIFIDRSSTSTLRYHYSAFVEATRHSTGGSGGWVYC